MDPDVIGIFILGRAMLTESAERAFETAWAMDGQAISMPTNTGNRIARLRTTLTRKVIDALQPTDRSWIAWDDKLTGFGVRIHPSGAKSFIVNYRAGDGGSNAPIKRVTIGRYGRVAPDQARWLARRLLAQVADNTDPAFERAMALAKPSLDDGAGVGTPVEQRSEAKMETTSGTRYLNTRDAAEFLGLSTRTMGRLRITGDGPPFFYRFGGCVRYARAELKEWAAGQRRISTSDDCPC